MKDWSTLNKELIKGWIVEAPLVNSQGINTTTGPVPGQIQALNEGSQGTTVLALAAITIGTIAVGSLIWWYWGSGDGSGTSISGTPEEIAAKLFKGGKMERVDRINGIECIHVRLPPKVRAKIARIPEDTLLVEDNGKILEYRAEISCVDQGTGDIIASYETDVWRTEVLKRLNILWGNLLDLADNVADEDSVRKIDVAKEYVKRLAMLLST